MTAKLPIASLLVMVAFVWGGTLNTRGTTLIFTTAGNAIWTCPAGITNIAVECYGGGGGGGAGGGF